MKLKLLGAILLVIGPVSATLAANIISEWGGAVSAPANYEINQLQNTVTIKTGGTFKFQALDGTNLGVIDLIVVDPAIPTPATITLLVGRDPNDPADPQGSAGAIAVKKIDLVAGGVTSVISGLDITGDFLELQAGTMSIDGITGAVIIGGAVRNAMTINGALEGSLAVTGTVDGSLSFNGDVNGDITLEQPLTNPLTVTGSVNGVIVINNSNGPGPGLASGADILIAESGGVGGNLSGNIIGGRGESCREVGRRP